MIIFIIFKAENVFIDGAKNFDIFEKFFIHDYKLISETKLPVNSGKNLYTLKIYKNKNKNIYLIYYRCQLYGATASAEEQMLEIARYIKSIVYKTFET